MMCYRDRTFCPFHLTCAQGNTCDRALTEQVVADAIEWWGGKKAPIAQYGEHPKCWEEK